MSRSVSVFGGNVFMSMAHADTLKENPTAARKSQDRCTPRSFRVRATPAFGWLRPLLQMELAEGLEDDVADDVGLGDVRAVPGDDGEVAARHHHLDRAGADVQIARIRMYGHREARARRDERGLIGGH